MRSYTSRVNVLYESLRAVGNPKVTVWRTFPSSVVRPAVRPANINDRMPTCFPLAVAQFEVALDEGGFCLRFGHGCGLKLDVSQTGVCERRLREVAAPSIVIN